MNILNTLSLKSNRQLKINFDGDDLSSDANLLLTKGFVSKLGIDKQNFSFDDMEKLLSAVDYGMVVQFVPTETNAE